MKAVVLYGRAQLEIREIPVPECGEDDILLRVDSTTICGGDMHYYLGTADTGKLPVVLGHEFAGTIVKMGNRVDNYWKVGDRVVSDNTSYACGHCANCAKGDFVNCEHRGLIGGDHDGGFTKYVLIPGQILKIHPNGLMKLPDGIGMEEAPVLEPASNCYKAVIQEGGLRPGENFVVFGAGPLGLFSLEQATVGGAVKRIMITMSRDKNTVRYDLCKKYGATHILFSDEEEDVVAKVKEICGENGVDLVVDAAGAPICMKQAIDMVNYEGRIVRIGYNHKPYEESFDRVTSKSITIRGHMGYNPESWRRTMALVNAGMFDVKSCISHTLPLEQFREGFEMMKSGEASKVRLVYPEDE